MMLLEPHDAPASRPEAAAGSETKQAFERMFRWVVALGSYIRGTDEVAAVYEAAVWIRDRRPDREHGWLRGFAVPGTSRDDGTIVTVYPEDIRDAQRVIDAIEAKVVGAKIERDRRLLLLLADHESTRAVGRKLGLNQTSVRDRASLQWKAIRKKLVDDDVIADSSADEVSVSRKARKIGLS